MQGSLDSNLAFEPAKTPKTYHVSAGDITASLILGQLMEVLSRTAPNIKVHCFQTDRREIARALAAGTIDVAIDIPQLSPTALNKHRLFEGDHVCIMRKGHPCQNEEWNIERFLTLDHIAVSSRSKGSSLLELALSRVGQRVVPKLRVQQYLTALEVVQASDLVLFAPRSITTRLNVSVRELPFEQAGISSWLYWHRNVEDDPANRWFRELIIELNKKHPAHI